MDLSIVIVNYRGWKHLGFCLDSLVSIDKKARSMEIIVVDNDSGDGQLSVFEKQFQDVHFISNKGNLGFASACNLGAARSKGEYLLFLNPDIIANAEAIFGMMEILSTTPDIVLLSCRQQNNAGKEEHPYNLFPDLFTLNGPPRSIYKAIHKKELDERHSREKDLIYPDWVSGSVMMTRKENFLKTGGWNEDYWLYYEDVEFCRQISNLGGRIALSNRYSMIHNHGGATRINPKTAALAKAEVRISKHVYVSHQFNGVKAFLLHLFTILGSVFGKLIPTLFSIPFFFNRKLRSYGRLYVRLWAYYFGVIKNGTWLSPRAPNFQNK